MGQVHSRGSAPVACFVISGGWPALLSTFQANTIWCTIQALPGVSDPALRLKLCTSCSTRVQNIAKD